MNDERGRLLASGTTRPCTVRYRAMLARETVTRWWCCRCQRIVSGPQSRPCAARSLRTRTISSIVAGSIAFGEVFGRRERGRNAASPSARYRATSLDTQPLDTPYARATSAWARPSTTTAVITSLALDTTDHRRAAGASYVSTHRFPMSRDRGFRCPEPAHRRPDEIDHPP